MNEKVSIIIPVYNIQGYVAKCIESVLHQEYLNLEIILIDDGSEDGTTELCEKYEQIDTRVNFVRQINQGVVEARKRAFALSTGAYVMFIDGDDYIDRNMVGELLEIITDKKAEVVTSGTFVHSGNAVAKVHDMVEEGEYTTQGELKNLFSKLIFKDNYTEYGILPYLCGKMYKRDVIKKLFKNFERNVKVGEDAAINYSIITGCTKIVVTHKIYYHYIMRGDSASHSAYEYFFDDMGYVYRYLKNNFEKNRYAAQQLLEQLEIFMVRTCLLGIKRNFKCSIPFYWPILKINSGSRIIIYGAGQIGRDYYKILQSMKSYNLLAWVDKKFDEYSKRGMAVLPPDIIEKIEYEYLIIAVKRQDMAEKIMDDLTRLYGVNQDKMIWVKPLDIIEISAEK